jgi:cytidylate kinase
VVITLSRQAEAGGEEIAGLLCQRANLKLADKAILARIARQEGLPLAQFAVFDESVPGPIEAVLTEWRTSVSHGVYLRRLVQALLALEREDNVVIVGRGAAFVLTDPGTLHVRVCAPMPCRVARLLQRAGLYRSQAQRMLERADRTRARFIRESFQADIEAPPHYDLVLNTAEMPPDDAVEIILAAAQRKSSRRALSPETPPDFVTHVLRFSRRPRLPRVSEIVWRRCERRSSG